MQILWSYVAFGVLMLMAAVTVAGGEAAAAELKLAEAATRAAVAGAVCLLSGPEAALSSASAAMGVD
ncbi:hypothetical protein WKW77_21910 [Variovorax ureilyticus]|uniref:Uncharacterized protein n=1 Tax=Variovorax ureilyticus TaxID=1836198 RepID=A0ABU8VJC5_9BURK